MCSNKVLSFIFALTLISSAIAAPTDFVEMPILVQEINSDGSIANQFIDVLQKNPISGNFEPQTTYYLASRFFGMCLSQTDSTCVGSYKFYDQMSKFLATANGRVQAETQYLPVVPNFEASTQTQIIEEVPGSLKLKVTTKYATMTSDFSTDFILKRLPELAQVPHQFLKPEKDESHRKSVTEVEDHLKSLSNKVVMLQTDINSENMVGSGGRSQGTGFFLSDDGFMMTNHHVIDSFSKCMKNYSCEVNFTQVLENGQRKEFRTNVSILIMSEAHDFSLLKVKLPQDIQISHFEIEKNQVGPNLTTLGYPADKTQEPDSKTQLTYSFGRLVGFHGQTYATSNYIYGGASGSPIFNSDSLKLVGILSNGIGTVIQGVGAPGLARPIYSIDAEFGISDYLSGTKQERVKTLLRQITEAKSGSEVTIPLQKLQNEKTFYGLPLLKQLMVNHEVKEVRKEISRTLQRMGVLAGSKI